MNKNFAEESEPRYIIRQYFSEIPIEIPDYGGEKVYLGLIPEGVQLWDMLLTLTANAAAGLRFFLDIQGPVDAG
eukprot:1719333-Karenia_brevis.AAC.1